MIWCGLARARPSRGDPAAECRCTRRDRQGIAKPGDYVVCLGAGNITQWAYALPGELKALG